MTCPLLPEPKSILHLSGSFRFGPDTCIALLPQADESAVFAARQLQTEIQRATQRELPVIQSGTPPKAAILLICDAQQAAASTGGSELCGDLPDDQAYELTIHSENIVLCADAPRGLFYGVQTLRQLVRHHGRACLSAGLPAMVIRDWPALPYRGLMLDVSRGKVPTLETLYHLVTELSHYKINVLQLYTEHTFQFPRHPRIGAGCDPLTGADILALDAFCRAHHVELMPNLQSFGHVHRILQLPEYRHLAESEMLWSFSPACEGTYRLLDELYGDLLPAFTSHTFNVNCDETYDLGTGASKPLADRLGRGQVYLNHILRLRDLAAGYGRRIQIWGDILLHYPDLIGQLPPDVTLLDWGYDAADEYPSTRTFGASGRTFWVCPGTSSWNALFPRLYNANVNIRNLVRDGTAAGAAGMLLTDWGDYGHYQPLGLSWYGYLFGAAQGWSGGATTDEAFEAAFGPLFFGPAHKQILRAIHLLARTNILPGIPGPNISRTVLALFDEPLVGETVTSLPPETLRDMLMLSQEAIAILDPLAAGHPRERTLREIASVARLTAYAGRKTAVGQQLRRALAGTDLNPGALHRYEQAFQDLDRELDQLQAEFEALWLARARRSEMQIALRYYAGLHDRYGAVISWLQEQGRALADGQPVDADLAAYDGSGYRVLWQA